MTVMNITEDFRNAKCETGIAVTLTVSDAVAEGGFVTEANRQIKREELPISKIVLFKSAKRLYNLCSAGVLRGLCSRFLLSGDCQFKILILRAAPAAA